MSPSPRANSRRSPLPRLVLAVMLASLLRLLLPHLPGLSPVSVWYAADVLRPLGMAAALAAVLHLLPWSQLRLCCIVAALVGHHVADAALCAAWYWGAKADPYVWFALQGAASVALGAWYWRRSYDQPSDTLDYDHVFCLRRRPRSAQDLLVSMLGCFGPQGTYAIYAAGVVYHFHRGKLVTTPHQSRSFADYVATKGRTLQMSHIMALDALRGVKWSPFTNCITVLGAFWRKHGR